MQIQAELCQTTLAEVKAMNTERDELRAEAERLRTMVDMIHYTLNSPGITPNEFWAFAQDFFTEDKKE